jgi:hypothetical protein
MGCLREAGFSFRNAVHAYSMLDSYTYGFALQERTIPFETPQEAAEMARATVGDTGAQYPYLAEAVEEFAKDGYDYAKEFEFGLDVILDGLERYIGPSRPTSQRKSMGPERSTIQESSARTDPSVRSISRL